MDLNSLEAKMNNIKIVLITIIVGALCTCFFFIGKNVNKGETIYDTDTLYITKTDTIQIKIKELAILKDTVVIVDKDTIYYQYASIDTLIAKDSSYVNLNIGYDEYFKRFDIQASFMLYERTKIIKQYIESPKEFKRYYGSLFAGVIDKEIGIGLESGIYLKNDYSIGIEVNSKTLGLTIGRRW